MINVYCGHLSPLSVLWWMLWVFWTQYQDPMVDVYCGCFVPSICAVLCPTLGDSWEMLWKVYRPSGALENHLQMKLNLNWKSVWRLANIVICCCFVLCCRWAQSHAVAQWSLCHIHHPSAFAIGEGGHQGLRSVQQCQGQCVVALRAKYKD